MPNGNTREEIEHRRQGNVFRHFSERQNTIRDMVETGFLRYLCYREEELLGLVRPRRRKPRNESLSYRTK